VIGLAGTLFAFLMPDFGLAAFDPPASSRVRSDRPREWFGCYGLSGLLCAVGAIIYLYQNISATPGEGADYLLLSFAATIVGGVYMYGGERTIPGVLVGEICLASITSALTIAGIPPSIYQGVLGFARRASTIHAMLTRPS
jgi:ABC-type glucose/galactose transport system permease subunit